MTTMTVGDRMVGDSAPTYIIAEIGSNHDGELEEAVRLIEAAASAGADCVKFQSFRAETLVAPTHPGYSTLRRLALPRAWYPTLQQTASRAGVHFTSTPFDLDAVDDLVKLGVPALKVASGDLTYPELLRAVGATNLPVWLSTGAAYLGEVDEAMRTLQAAGATEIALLHCASAYPARYEAANVRALQTLRAAFGVPVGLSDHTPGYAAAISAVALGASAIEKHITVDRSRRGPDHPFALLVEEFADLVKNIRAVEAALGNGVKEPVDVERSEREWARRGVYTSRALEQGHVLEPSDLICLRPARGVPAHRREDLIGRAVRQAVGPREPLTWELV